MKNLSAVSESDMAVKYASKWRTDFPIFSHHPDWSYLDSAATAQKPRQVIDALAHFWSAENAPLHRGVYRLSAEVTLRYEAVRKKIANYIGSSTQEIVFCRGTTDAINLVAYSYVAPRLSAGANIVISALEHHANFVPWQQLCKKYGAELRVIPLQLGTVEGHFREHLQCRLDLEAADTLIDSNTKLLALNHVSNVLGQINPVAELCQMAKAKKVPVLLDGAQAVVHSRVDVRALDCDFYVFSGHKLYGPDGVGVLYGRSDLLQDMPPYQSGGDMIEYVSLEEVSFAPAPQRFEAGTMPVSAVFGLGVAIDYLESLSHNSAGRNSVECWERELLVVATEALRTLPELQKVRIIGDEENLDDKVAIISFVVDGVHPHDVGSILDSANVAVRAGHHCAQPLMQYLGLAATTRASFAFYNNLRDVERLCEGLQEVIKMML